MAKVESVKLQMQDNIQQALENCVKLEKIENDAGLFSFPSVSLNFLSAVCRREKLEGGGGGWITCVNARLSSANLQASAGIFRQQAKSLKSKMWWKNLKMKLCIAAIVIIILVVIIIVICLQAGVFNKSSSSSDSSGSGKRALSITSDSDSHTIAHHALDRLFGFSF